MFAELALQEVGVEGGEGAGLILTLPLQDLYGPEKPLSRREGGMWGRGDAGNKRESETRMQDCTEAPPTCFPGARGKIGMSK